MIGLIFTFSFIFGTYLAEECNIKGLNSSPACSQIFFDSSLRAFYDKRLERAVEGFEKVVKGGKEPWSKRSIFMLGRAYLEMGKNEEARENFLRAISEYDELADYSLYYLSESLLREKDYEEAARILRLLYETYTESPLRPLAQFKEAESLYLLGKYEEAARAFGDFTTKNPKSPLVSEARLYKGKALKGAGMREEALNVFKGIWVEDPASSSAVKVREELMDVRLTVEDHLLRAENLSKVSQYSKGLLDLHKALELEQDTQKANKIKLRIGITLFKDRRYGEAIEVIDKILSQWSGVEGQVLKEALYYAAKAYLRKGNKEKFLTASNEFYRLFPDDNKTPEVLLTVADELRKSGDKGKALAIFDLIIKEYPQMSADALFQRGWMEYLSGNFEKSSRDMRSLIERFPASQRVPQALYWEARGYDKSGNNSKADTIYRKLVKEYPATFYGYQAGERLRKKGEGNPAIKEDLMALPLCAITISDPETSSGPFPKVRELKTLGMKVEAVAELDYFRDRYSGEDLGVLLKIGEAYINLGEYRRAISMAEGYRPGHQSQDPRLRYLSYPLGFLPILSQYSKETEIDLYLLAALIREESRFDPRATSRAGAKGLMQVIPSTWDWISGQRNKKAETKDKRQETKDKLQETSIIRNSSPKIDPFDPQENIARGSWYLRYLLDRFNHNLIIAFSAYNAGPKVVNLWIKNGPEEPDEFIEEIPYSETKGYIKRVLRSYKMYKKIYNIPGRCL